MLGRDRLEAACIHPRVRSASGGWGHFWRLSNTAACQLLSVRSSGLAGFRATGTYYSTASEPATSSESKVHWQY